MKPIPENYSPLARLAALLVVFLVAGLALSHVAITINTIKQFTLTNAFQDQFRLYDRYLSEPFPLSIFLLENGHRPIVPGLLRWLELNYFSGAQILQITFAWLCAALTSLLLLRLYYQGRRLPVVIGVAGAIAATIMWNANARMFIHAYEAVHVFPIYAALVGALYLSADCGGRSAFYRLLVALVLCVLATISFGPGIVTFAAVGFLLILHRMPWRVILCWAGASAFVLLAYTFLLPGGDGVRAASKAFVIGDTMYFLAVRVSAYWLELLTPWWGAHVAANQTFCLAVACVTVGATFAAVGRRFFLGRQFSRTELVSAGLVAFGFLTNAAIAINRTGHFLEHPGDATAERYLCWSAVLWLGIALYWIDRAEQRSHESLLAILGVVLLVGSIAIERANWWRSWSSSTYRIVQLTAVAYEQNIAHPHRLIEIAGANVDETQRAISRMREAGTMIFAKREEDLLDRQIPVGRIDTAVERISATVDVADSRNMPVGSPWGIIAFDLPRSIAYRYNKYEFWLVDSNNVAKGRCARTGTRRTETDYSRYFRTVHNKVDCYVNKSASTMQLVAHRGEEWPVIASVLVRQ